MKFKKIAFLLIAVLSVSLLFACSPQQVEQKLDALEDSVEQKIDKVEDKTENAVKPSGNSSAAKITAEEAQKIALDHAGFTDDQVTGLHTELDVDDGISYYEVQFYNNRTEYDYEINAETGEIISFELDN